MTSSTSGRSWAIAVFFTAVLGVSAADEKFATLKVGDQTYRNVTITSVTATDIYFNHAGGFGNAKLKNLDAELQRHFQFDPELATVREQQQKQGNADYRTYVETNVVAAPKPAPKPAAPSEMDDPIAPQIFARSFRGQRPPQIVVEKWMTTAPNVDGRFLILSFWATDSLPSTKAIPTLNNWQNRFRNKLVIMGLTHETELEVRRLKSPVINYAHAIDTQARTAKGLALQAVPHILLIDPRGFVRYEGSPAYLSDDDLVRFLEEYDLPDADQNRTANAPRTL